MFNQNFFDNLPDELKDWEIAKWLDKESLNNISLTNKKNRSIFLKHFVGRLEFTYDKSLELKEKFGIELYNNIRKIFDAANFPNFNRIIHIQNFDQSYYKEGFPKYLKVFYASFEFNQKLNKLNLPDDLEKLIFGKFNHKIQKGDLPNNLKYIDFGDKFNKTIEIGSLPLNIKKIIFGDNFNQPLDNILPQGLKKLEIEGLYNHPLKLPLNLKSLSLETYTLPILKGYLPEDLEKFQIDECNMIEDGALPNSVKEIVFGEWFNLNIDKIIPPNLEYLEFLDVYPFKIEAEILPESLKTFKLTTKEIMYYENENCNKQFSIGTLPKNLKHLTVSMYDEPFYPNVLPEGLEELELDGFNQQLIPGEFPISLKKIKLGYTFKQNIENGIFNNFETIELHIDWKKFEKSETNGLKILLPFDYDINKISEEYKPYLVT